jgi:hypothetical protein
LPFCHLQIKALRCSHPRLWNCTQRAPKAPKTLGEHIKRRRLELHIIHLACERKRGYERHRLVPTYAPDALQIVYGRKRHCPERAEFGYQLFANIEGVCASQAGSD